AARQLEAHDVVRIARLQLGPLGLADHVVGWREHARGVGDASRVVAQTGEGNYLGHLAVLLGPAGREANPAVYLETINSGAISTAPGLNTSIRLPRTRASVLGAPPGV